MRKVLAIACDRWQLGNSLTSIIALFGDRLELSGHSLEPAFFSGLGSYCAQFSGPLASISSWYSSSFSIQTDLLGETTARSVRRQVPRWASPPSSLPSSFLFSLAPSLFSFFTFSFLAYLVCPVLQGIVWYLNDCCLFPAICLLIVGWVEHSKSKMRQDGSTCQTFCHYPNWTRRTEGATLCAWPCSPSSSPPPTRPTCLSLSSSSTALEGFFLMFWWLILCAYISDIEPQFRRHQPYILWTTL